VKKSVQFLYVLLALVILAGLLTVMLFAVLGNKFRYTENRPQESDLIGVYRPNLITRMLIKETGGSTFTNGAINIAIRNKIALDNVWHWLNDGDINNKEISGVDLSNGIWKLEIAGSRWQISAYYQLTNGAMTISLPLAGQKPPYSIVIDDWQTGVPFYFVQGTN
jgi:hypothetical protein